MQQPGETLCLEVTIHSATGLPPLSKNKKTIDPYVLLWLKSEEGKKGFHRSKSKNHEKNCNPLINETWIFTIPPANALASGINDALKVRWHHFVTIGSQEVAPAQEVSLAGLTVGMSTEPKEIQIGGGGLGSFSISYQFYSCPTKDVPVPKLSHSGGSVDKVYNSITRTEIKKRLREGDRGSDQVVEFLNVTVHEAKVTATEKNGTSSPYFFIRLNSSATTKYRGSKQSNTTNPQWNQTFGFETALVIKDVVQDAVVVDVVGFNAPLLPGYPLGTATISLSDIKPGGTITNWFPLKGTGTNAESAVRVTLKRTKKAVCELDVQATGLIDSMTKKIIYALNLCRKALGALGISCTISLELKLAVVAVRMSAKLDPKLVDEEKIAKELAEAENQMDQDELANSAPDQVAVTDTDLPPVDKKDIGILKSLLVSGVTKLASNIQLTSKRLGNLGITGSFGTSIIIGVAMYGCEFSIGVDVDMGADVMGEGHMLGTESQLGRGVGRTLLMSSSNDAANQ